jgi:hypothetical protein
MIGDILVSAGIMVGALLVQYVAVPYVRLQRRRRDSRRHIPEPQEIWVQDDGVIYVDAVTTMGVELMAFNDQSRTYYRWRDSWDDWNKRLRVKTCYFTGERTPLEG